MQTFKTILNDVWDKVNHQLQGASWAGSGIASYLFATDTDILNDVWDPVNHNLRIVGSGGGSGTVTASGPPVAGQAAEWTTATNITGVAVTGTGSYVKGTNPVLVTPALGTPTALVLTNATLLPDGALSANVPLLNASNVFSIGQRVLSLGIGVAAPALTGQIDATTVASTGTVPPMFRLTGAAHTALTASVARPSISLDFSASQQWATGAGPTIQAIIDILQPGAITAVGASTFPSATTFYVRGAPPKGTNVTLTKTSAMQIDGGAISTAGIGVALEVNAPTGATANYAALFNGGFVGVGQSTPLSTVEVLGSVASRPVVAVRSDSSGTTIGGNFEHLAIINANGGVGTYAYLAFATTASGASPPALLGAQYGGASSADLFFRINDSGGLKEIIRLAFSDLSMVLGTGEASATLTGRTLRGPNATGANIAAVDTTIQASLPTGSGALGNLLFKAATTVGGSSSTLNTATTHLTVGSAAVKLGSSINFQQSNGTVRITDGGVFRSSDNTAGATAGPFTTITAITIKDGLVTSLTGA